MGSTNAVQNVPDLQLNDAHVSAPSSPKDFRKDKANSTSGGTENTRGTTITQKEVDRFEDRIMDPMESGYTYTKAYDSETGDAVITAVKEMGDVAWANIDTKAIDSGIRGFEEGTRALLAALDEVKSIHPFIGVAVLAFRAVVMLELKRRDNDRKVISLKIEMSEMMAVLLELSNIKDSNHRGPDGTTLQGRMQRLIKSIAKDITACGNVCDTYTKKGIVVKVLKGPIYEGQFADYAARFTERRTQIEQALTIHTALGVESANRTLADVHKNVRAVNEKMDLMLLFRKLDSPHEKELLKFIDSKGGPKACLANDSILKELSFVNESIDPTSALSALRDDGGLSPRRSQTLDYKAYYILRKDLREDVQEALQNNMAVFERKLNVQKRQIINEVEGAVHREGDRVITAVTSGPHDRILDPDLHELWQENGWKGSVKSRHFILALHDYMLEKVRNPNTVNAEHFLGSPLSTTSALDASSRSSASNSAEDLSVAISTDFSTFSRRRRDHDGWALAYISILRVQPLLEAFDDDATGWISVKEANQFTSSRPKDWSLSRWIAFWAAGWHSTIWAYQNKICGVLQAMLQTLTSVLHANRVIADGYLADSTFTKVDLLLRSVTPTNTYDLDLDQKMQPYVLEEEKRLEHNLQSVAWEIDDANTLSLITGPGRIERYIFPLLYLLLRHHLRIIQVACKEVLHANEFNSLTQSLANVFYATQERINALSAIFKQKNLDVAAQLSKFAFGMFLFLSDPALHQDPTEGNSLYSWWVDDCSPDDADASILKLGVFNEFDVAPYRYPAPAAETSTSKNPFSSIIGKWSGHCFIGDGEYQTESLLEITVNSCAADGQFDGQGYEAVDGSFVVSGQVRSGEGSDLDVTFTREFPGITTRPIIFCSGKIEEVTNGLNGGWGYDSENMNYMMCLNRTAAPLYRFRFTREEFATNRPRARWIFACRAVLFQVRQRNCSWRFMKESIAERRRFVNLYTRRDLNWAWYTPLDFLMEGEREELTALELKLSPYDNRLYRLIAKARVRRVCFHHNTFCSVCHYTMREFRMICVTCMSKDFVKQVDLCLSCIDASVTLDQFDHKPDHPLVKVKWLLQDREKPNLKQNSLNAVDRAKALFPGPTRHIEPNPLAIAEDKDVADVGTTTGNDLDLDRRKFCICCNTLVSVPFWICVSCVDVDTLICIDCDTKKRLPLNLDSRHDHTHPLARYQYPEIGEQSEAKSMEAKFASFETSMTERLDRLEAAFNGRLDAMENLLRAFVTGREARA